MRDAIAIDFDGTLCKNEYPGIGEPIEIVIREAKRKQAEGCGLILWTCREGKLLDEAIDWCREHGLVFDAINDNLPEWKEMFQNNPRKVGATEYWDDRGFSLENIIGRGISEYIHRKYKLRGEIK